MTSFVVAKFGGTSVADYDAMNRSADVVLADPNTRLVVLSASALLTENPQPTEHEVREALAGNLCRCTGYEPIVDTVLAVAKKAGRKPASRRARS